MKSFDYNGVDSQFEVAGEVFTWRKVRPEDQTELAEILTKEFADSEDANLQMKIMDRQVLLFIEDGEHEQWTALRERSENPVTLGQLIDIVNWLVEMQSSRPTQLPASSSPGRGKTAASSKAA